MHKKNGRKEKKREGERRTKNEDDESQKGTEKKIVEGFSVASPKPKDSQILFPIPLGSGQDILDIPQTKPHRFNKRHKGGVPR